MATCINVFSELKQVRKERDMYKAMYERERCKNDFNFWKEHYCKIPKHNETTNRKEDY